MGTGPVWWGQTLYAGIGHILCGDRPRGCILGGIGPEIRARRRGWSRQREQNEVKRSLKEEKWALERKPYERPRGVGPYGEGEDGKRGWNVLYEGAEGGNVIWWIPFLTSCLMFSINVAHPRDIPLENMRTLFSSSSVSGH